MVHCARVRVDRWEVGLAAELWRRLCDRKVELVLTSAGRLFQPQQGHMGSCWKSKRKAAFWPQSQIWPETSFYAGGFLVVKKRERNTNQTQTVHSISKTTASSQATTHKQYKHPNRLMSCVTVSTMVPVFDACCIIHSNKTKCTQQYLLFCRCGFGLGHFIYGLKSLRAYPPVFLLCRHSFKN